MSFEYTILAASRLPPKNLRHPILFELRLGHLNKSRAALRRVPEPRSANQQNDWKLGTPILPLAEQNLAYFERLRSVTEYQH